MLKKSIRNILTISCCPKGRDSIEWYPQNNFIICGTKRYKAHGKENMEITEKVNVTYEK